MIPKRILFKKCCFLFGMEWNFLASIWKRFNDWMGKQKPSGLIGSQVLKLSSCCLLHRRFLLLCFSTRSLFGGHNKWSNSKLTLFNKKSCSTIFQTAFLWWLETGFTSMSYFQESDSINKETVITRTSSSIQKGETFLWILMSGTGLIRSMHNSTCATTPESMWSWQSIWIQLVFQLTLRKLGFISNVLWCPGLTIKLEFFIKSMKLMGQLKVNFQMIQSLRSVSSSLTIQRNT